MWSEVMTDGCLGAHIVANSPGYSRDIALSCAWGMGGKYAVVVNDPLLAQMMLSVGIIPLYRVKNADWDDDNAHQHFDARVYIRKLHAEAPLGAVLYPINEPGTQDLARLNQWTLDAVDEANKLGRKVCMYNWSYRNPRPEHWDTLATSARVVAAGGHFFGAHEGYDLEFPSLSLAFPECIGRFLPAKRRFGGNWIVTEFAASKTAHDGWSTWLTWQQWAQLVRDAVRDVYAPNGVHVTPFTAFEWMRGFDYVNAPELRTAFNEINVRLPVVITPSLPFPAPDTLGTPQPGYVLSTSANLANVRRDPTTRVANVIGALYKNDVVSYRPQTYANEGYHWTHIEAPFAGWVSNVASIAAGAPPTPDTPIISISLPYVSQNGTTATRFRNECGVASGLMLVRWRYQKAGLLDAPLLTVDDAAAKTPLLTLDDGLTLVEVQTLLRGYGVTATTEREVTPDRIIELLRAGKPVLVLVNQKYFGGADTGHFVVVNAYGERGFWVQDPDKKGANWYITREELDKALKEVTKFAAWTNQGLIAA
jgi:hypothetical protein